MARAGKTVPLPRMSPEEFADRFSNLLREEPEPKHVPGIGPCLIWMGHTIGEGRYGQVEVAGTAVLLHRLAFVAAGGVLTPEKPNVLHKCDRPACVRFGHLFAGDAKDNAEDRDQKGRATYLRGDRHWTRFKPECVRRGENHPRGYAKLNESDVLEIRRLYAQSGVTQRALAERFEVDRKTISRIVRGDTWKHVTETEEAA